MVCVSMILRLITSFTSQIEPEEKDDLSNTINQYFIKQTAHKSSKLPSWFLFRHTKGQIQLNPPFPEFILKALGRGFLEYQSSQILWNVNKSVLGSLLGHRSLLRHRSLSVYHFSINLLVLSFLLKSQNKGCTDDSTSKAVCLVIKIFKLNLIFPLQLLVSTKTAFFLLLFFDFLGPRHYAKESKKVANNTHIQFRVLSALVYLKMSNCMLNRSLFA